jgi:TRAP-type C4-dicarboxylate transport system permease small subunit
MESVIKIFNISNRFLIRMMKTVIIFITIMATCTMFLQVVSRYVFNISISGLDELTGHTAVWLYLMGAAYGTYDKSHIKADMAGMFIKNERIKYGIKIMSSVIATVMACFMVSWSFDYIHWSIIKHELTPTLRIPTVIFQISILIGSVLMAVYFIKELADLISARKEAKCQN